MNPVSVAALGCFAVEHPAGLVKHSCLLEGVKWLLDAPFVLALSPWGVFCLLLLFAAALPGQRDQRCWGTMSRETPKCSSTARAEPWCLETALGVVWLVQ